MKFFNRPLRATLRASLLATVLLSACSPSEQAAEQAAEKAPEKSVVKLTDAELTALHERVLTLDTHIDIPLTYMTEIDPTAETDLQVDLPKLTAGKLDAGFWIVYTPQGDLMKSGYAAAAEIAETRMAAIEALVATHADNFELAKTAADVRRITSVGKQAILVGMETRRALYGPHAFWT